MTSLRRIGKLVKALALLSLFTGHAISQTPNRVSGSGLRDIRLPIGAHVTWVGKNIQQNGSSLDILAFHSRQSMKEVLGFYRLAWAKNATASAPGFVEHTTGGWSVISTMLDQSMILLQVRAGLHFRTHGFFSALEFNSPATVYIRPVDVPLPGGSRILSTTGTNDGAKKGRTVIAENTLSVQQNFQFFRDRMRSGGWRLSAASGRTDEAALMFDKAGEYCEISVIPVNDGNSLLLVNRVSDGN